MPRDTDIELFQRHWPQASVPNGLAERIVANATRLPQHISLRARIAGFFRLPEERWALALAYPTAALAVIVVMVSLYSAQISTAGIDDNADVDALILDMMNDDDL